MLYCLLDVKTSKLVERVEDDEIVEGARKQ